MSSPTSRTESTRPYCATQASKPGCEWPPDASRRPFGSTSETSSALPASVEAAIYFAILEAMQNATRHAPGAQVTVTVAEHEGTVLFEVADDGPGFDPDEAGRGHGMLNICDRIGAIGGTVRWDSSPGNAAG